MSQTEPPLHKPNNKNVSDVEHVQELDSIRAKHVTNKDAPLVEHMFTADPSAHVFEGRLYVYPSHDILSDVEFNDSGDHFAMRDYHVLSLNDNMEEVVDHGVVLSISDVTWAQRQMWAPDAATKNGKYYFYFPAKDHEGVFRIGVAIGDKPEGPFIPESKPIPGAYSIDPAVFEDDDGQHYLYFGGIWGGQLQCWMNDQFQGVDCYPQSDEAAIAPKVARLTSNMLTLAEPPQDVLLIDERGELVKTSDNQRRFFEASWMHKYQGRYYFSYSTGDSHKIVYAIGDNPYGPFTYQGIILEPVLGWTTHHSIVKYCGKWWLFYHDSSLSKGQTHLRCVKKTELTHDENGMILTLNPYR